jgi:ornithine carbamoyltransferase
MNDFISINSCDTQELKNLLLESAELKAMYKSGKRDLCLSGKTLVMLFEKPSLRTRMSFQVAVTDLGGSPIYVKPEDIGGKIGAREPVKDMARVLSGYVQAIMARTFNHQTVLDLAQFADVPVINALTDWSHPCQTMADILTIQEHLGDIKGATIAYIGDGNNVARSLAFGCAKMEMKLVIASPKGYELDAQSITNANKIAPDSVIQMTDPAQAVKDADVVYTDTWVSMGQEDEKEKRIKDFTGYEVNQQLLDQANKKALIMHCLPAYRGYEISDAAVESESSIIFDQAENRLHFQRALLKKLMS